MPRVSLGSPMNVRPKYNSAKKFLSLQMSQMQQTGRSVSNDINQMLRHQAVSRKRRKVVNEIIDSEKSYQEHLTLICKLFLQPLRKLDYLNNKAIDAIFSNVENIQAISKELLNQMDTLGLGDAFLALAPFLKLYCTYANNFQNASAVLQEWEKKSSQFKTFKIEQEGMLEMKGLKLRALLITPVQRVPRYKMLLESLLLKTPQEHPDYQKLQEATEQIRKIASHINENIRQHENFQKMLSIQKGLTGDGAPKILAPGRLFVKEGPLLKVCERTTRERMFFLFSDILICSKKKFLDKDSCTYTCQCVFPLMDCKVESLLGGSQETGYGGLFKVSCGKQSILLMSTSQIEAMSWVQNINEEISKLKESRASLKKDDSTEEAEEDWKEKRNVPLRRSAVLRSKQKAKKVIAKLESYSECASPRSKDSLYPMRKSLQTEKTSKSVGVYPTRKESKSVSSDASRKESSSSTSTTDTIYEDVFEEDKIMAAEGGTDFMCNNHDDDDEEDSSDDEEYEMDQEEEEESKENNFRKADDNDMSRTLRASTRQKKLTIKYNQVISPPPKYKDDHQHLTCVNMMKAPFRRTKSIRKKYK